MGSGKPRGLKAARNLKTQRMTQRWNQKSYTKRWIDCMLCPSVTLTVVAALDSHSSRIHNNAFQGASHAKGIVVEKMCGLSGRLPHTVSQSL
jgi:small subunit ribosomal protein S23e